MAEGIDIYVANQTVSDWNKVKAAGISWCYQKVSDGTGTRSAQKVKDGQNAGVLQGGYHFSQPGSAVDQARLLLSQCSKYGLYDLKPCLDLEDNPPQLNKPNIPDSQKAMFAVAFGREILASGNGYTLYANDSTWKLINDYVMRWLPDTFRWVARYRVAPPDSAYHAWQYTSTSSCPGIISNGLDRSKGSVPVNRKKGTFMALTDDQQAELLSKVDWMYKTLGNTPDVNHDGKAGDVSLGDFRQNVFDQLSTLNAKVDKIQVGGVDLDALAGKVADLLAARLKD